MIGEIFCVAYAIGLRRGEALRIILLPQAVRLMLPALISQLVTLLKDSSLGFVIGYTELLRNGHTAVEFRGAAATRSPSTPPSRCTTSRSTAPCRWPAGWTAEPASATAARAAERGRRSGLTRAAHRAGSICGSQARRPPSTS